jgi:ribonuclease D
VMWEPAGSDVDTVSKQLRGLGAREWQVGLTAPMLADAIASADAQPPD